MKRRTRGDGTLYRKGRVWWIAYKHPDGTRKQESTGTDRKEIAMRLLRKRVGAVEHNLPVIPRAEQLSFTDAAQAMIDDFVANSKKSEVVVRRRIRLHLMPFFQHRRLIGINSSDVTAYVAKRQKDTIVARKSRFVVHANGTLEVIPEVRRPVSPAEINRELQVLKRIFSLAINSGRIAMKPKITMLREAPARAGFFERDQYESVLGHLPPEVGAIISFAYITGWRIPSEVLRLEWRQVDFEAAEVRLDAGTTKNGQGRVFPMTRELRRVLEKRKAEREAAKKQGHVVPWVFFRMVAEGRGGDKKPQPILAFYKAWQAACRLAGCPGRIPHDLRRTAVRNLVRAGVPQTIAMALTGHKTDSVFRRYDIVSPDDLRVAVERLDTATQLFGRGSDRGPKGYL